MKSVVDVVIAFGLRRSMPGWGRLLRMLRGSTPLPLIEIDTQDGLVWTADPGSYMDAHVLREGFYEREVLSAALSNLQNGVFWDVGANVGLQALTVKRLRPEVTVVAFEPAPYPASRAMHHAQLNKLDVTFASVALGAQSGYANLSVMIGRNCGLSSLRPWPEVEYDTSIRVRVERADRLIEAGLPCPTVLKIDVEGCELEVLEGFGEYLEKVDAVIFESDGQQLHAIRQLLKMYAIEQLFRRDGTRGGNFVATRRPCSV